ncbi:MULTISPECIES: DUF2142 domain-containing protein [unclassified Agrococcus]|uniref:DUF2142 domain-containing protein n=1 Tax=unclassified Agrococcus TaxID=2615065 RepID=UPI00362227CA
MQRRLKDFVAGAAVFFALAMTWSLATPLMGVPDEPAHAVRAAAAAHGQLTSVSSEVVPGTAEFDVPVGIAQANNLACMAFDPTLTAECQPDVPDEAQPLGAGTSTAGLNLPTYYVLVGWPTLLLGGEAGMWAMRIVSILLCSLAVGAAVMELRSAPRSRWALTGLALAATPMTLWLAGSLNPNGLEWAASAAALAALVAIARDADASRGVLVQRVAVVVAAAVLLVSARSITIAWLLVAIAAALALANAESLRAVVRRRTLWIGVAIGALYAGACALWIVRPPQYDSYVLPVPGIGETFAQGFSTVWRGTPFYWRQMVGVFGWNDTQAPDIVVAAYAAAIGALVLGAVALARMRTRLVLLGVVAVMLIVPPVVQGLLVTEVGYMWQGRYMLAILAMLLIVAGIALDEREPSLGAARLQGTLLVVAATASAFALLVMAQRFAAGTDQGWRVFLLDPSWQPPLGTIGVTILAALTTAAAVLALVRAGDGRTEPVVVRSTASVR